MSISDGLRCPLSRRCHVTSSPNLATVITANVLALLFYQLSEYSRWLDDRTVSQSATSSLRYLYSADMKLAPNRLAKKLGVHRVIDLVLPT